MVETDSGTPKENSQEDMQALYETSMKSLQEGNVLKGRVINITGDSVIVDVGLKSEGIVSLQEFPPKEGEAQPVSVDDEVEVMIVGREKESGLLRLSKKRVDEIKTWEKIDRSLEDGTPLEGHILNEVKGGFIVDMGINAFLPLSQVDIKPVKNPASFVGRNLKFKVIKSNRRKGSIILSRRVLLEDERDKKRQEFWKNVKDGQIMYGFVRNITDYGAFVDLGGVDGFLHINDITWGKITHPKEYLRIGDEVKVKIIAIDTEKGRVSIGMKQLKTDPWLKIDEKYPVGSRVKGKVVGIVEYGAFVELEQGLEGLLHVSEMSWDKKFKNPAKLVNKGDNLELAVLKIDLEKKRISLGLKQLAPDPWDELEATYPPGSIVKGKVKNFTEFGMFVGIGNGIDGLVHMSELSWSRRKKTFQEQFKKGTTIDAFVLNIDKTQKKFSLSIKRLKEDPWKGVGDRYSTGDVVEGHITSITDFGVFVEIEEGIEGLIHVSEMDELQGKQPSEVFNLDDTIQAAILNIDEKDKRIALSTRVLRRKENRVITETREENTGAFSTLGDILEPAMKKNSGDTTD
ncbi:MAG: 30S ribosomal protein S1 [Syntrophorhabdus sp. PtaB.Bin047]|jgi:small subunit ribosomal protein S1|nr:MAG: 30S ribosomal protein S1 [Syntrophorhabdus sp. PtaB.Bin047]